MLTHLQKEPEVSFTKSDDEEELQLQDKEIVLTLFKAATRLGARKNLSFHTAKADNFTVELAFDSPENLPRSTPEKIAFYTISGVEKTRAHNYTGKPKIGLGFRLTTSGLIELEKAEAEITVVKWPEPVIEKVESEGESESVKAETKEEGEERAEENGSTFEEKAAEEEKGSSEEQQQESASEEEASKGDDEKEAGDKDEEKADEKGEKDDEDGKEEEKEEKKKDSKKKKEKEKEKEKKKAEAKRGPKRYVHRIPLTVQEVKLGIPEFGAAYVAKARKSMEAWDTADLVKKVTNLLFFAILPYFVLKCPFFCFVFRKRLRLRMTWRLIFMPPKTSSMIPHWRLCLLKHSEKRRGRL